MSEAPEAGNVTGFYFVIKFRPYVLHSLCGLMTQYYGLNITLLFNLNDGLLKN